MKQNPPEFNMAGPDAAGLTIIRAVYVFKSLGKLDRGKRPFSVGIFPRRAVAWYQTTLLY